jgi:hypothetical protein
MTAQEVLERYGFIPLWSNKEKIVPCVVEVQSGTAVPLGDKLLLVGRLERDEFVRICRDIGWLSEPGLYHYKAVAE